MNGNTPIDYQTRAIITGLIIVCATVLTIMKLMTPERWEYIVLTAGVVYMGVKFAKDYLNGTKANGNGKIPKNDFPPIIATAIRETAATTAEKISERKSGGNQNGNAPQ